MTLCVNKNDMGFRQYQEPMADLCIQALAAEFTSGSLIFTSQVDHQK